MIQIVFIRHCVFRPSPFSRKAAHGSALRGYIRVHRACAMGLCMPDSGVNAAGELLLFTDVGAAPSRGKSVARVETRTASAAVGTSTPLASAVHPLAAPRGPLHQRQSRVVPQRGCASTPLGLSFSLIRARTHTRTIHPSIHRSIPRVHSCVTHGAGDDGCAECRLGGAANGDLRRRRGGRLSLGVARRWHTRAGCTAD